MNGLRLRLQRWAATASLTLLCLTMVFSPLPFGSVGLPVIVIWVAVLGASAVLVAFQPMAQEIAKLRSLDLTDVHPAVVFSPVPASQQG